VIHTDLKSENVMPDLRRRRNARVITDFGLARHADQRSLRMLEGDPAIAGTVAYMAPEQFSGRPAGPATDIYALGIVLFELVAGRLPYDVKTLRS